MEENTLSAPSLLDRIARTIVLSLFFLVPVFVLPTSSIPLSFSKTALFIILTVVAFALWTLARIRDGEVALPRGVILPLFGLLTLSGIISTLASGALRLSWSGAWFEPTSLAFFVALVLFLFLAASLLRSADHIFYALVLFLASAAFVGFFHLVRAVAGPELFSFGFFTVPTDTLLVRWNDVGVFFGAVAVLLLVTLEFMKLRTGLRIVFTGALLASLALLAVVHLAFVWLLLGVFALVFLVYLISFKHLERAAYEEVRHPNPEAVETVVPLNPTEGASPTVSHASEGTTGATLQKRKIPPLSFGVFLCALAFVIFSGPLGGRIAARLNIVSVEARPSFGATMEVARETLKTAPFFGAGPNLFSRAWLVSKPEGTNQTIFWNTDFTSGVGFLPTLLVTQGLVGAFLWIAFLAAYLYAGFRFILAQRSDKVARYLVGAPFLTSLFLWLVLFVYTPGSVILVIAFGFTGLTLAALVANQAIGLRVVRFVDNPALSFPVVLGFVVALLSSGALLWSVGTRFVSALSFSRGIQAANSIGDLDAADTLIARALAHSPLDLYARARVEISLVRMNALASSANEENAATVRSSFEALLGSALSYGKRAVSLDPKNYANWVALGRVYEAVVPLKIAGAYDAAKSAYETAQSLNSRNPGLLLARARLEAANGAREAARSFIAQAIQLKPNYTEAVFFLSQLEVQEGNIRGAIDSVSAAIFLSPQDPVLHFQLGLLTYNQKDWRGAANAFERAISLNPDYANARYFLGLSYYQLKQRTDALTQFEALARTNPGNKEITLIVANLTAGRAPFANAEPPVDASPERRQALPVGDE